MDIGSGKLVDKIEEYFGRRIAMIVVGTAVLAIFIGAVGFIFANALLPLYSLIIHFSSEAALEYFQDKLIPGLITLLLGYIVFVTLWALVVRLFLERRIAKWTSEDKKRSEQFLENSQAKLENYVNDYADKVKQETNSKVEAYINEETEKLLSLQQEIKDAHMALREASDALGKAVRTEGEGTACSDSTPNDDPS